MRRNIIIYAYTFFTEEETIFWNNLAKYLKSKGFNLVMLATVEPKEKLNFQLKNFCHTLDQKVQYSSKWVKDNQDYSQILEREVLWYGQSNFNRLEVAKKNKFEFVNLLEETRPVIVVMANGHHAVDMILKNEVIKRNIPITYFERGCFPKSWHLDDNGITGETSIALTQSFKLPEHGNKLFKIYKEYYFKQKKSWWEQPEIKKEVDLRIRYNIPLDSTIVLFANQLNNDTSNFLFSPFFKNNEDAFFWFCKSIKLLKNKVFILVKKHPKFEGDEGAFKLALLKNNIKGSWIEDLDLFTCLEQSNLVCSVNSTINFEALLYGKPVLQLGGSILSRKSIVYQITSKEDTLTMRQWLHMDKLEKKLEKFENFMGYMLENELSFYSMELSKLGFNGFQFFGNQILDRVPLKEDVKYQSSLIKSWSNGKQNILSQLFQGINKYFKQ